jgi:hypothetical protein
VREPDDFDDESIGLLATPPPAVIHKWLANLGHPWCMFEVQHP